MSRITILLVVLTLAIFVSVPGYVAAADNLADTRRGNSTLLEVERRDTVIFALEGGPVSDPEAWNPFMLGRRLVHGIHQAMMEPLFILNYETEEIMPWLARSMTPNETFDTWTLKLRQGVKWSDGEAFNADDVVFSVRMLVEKGPDFIYIYSDSLRNWVRNVEKLDDLTVRFDLKRPHTRFLLDFWSVKIWTTPSIVPEHIWRDRDPLTFKNHAPEKGWPVFTGPYKLTSASETEFIYDRDDNWWGAKIGWKALPKPKRLIWRWIDQVEARAKAMEHNELDSLSDVPLGVMLYIKRRNKNIISHYRNLPYAWVPDPCARNLELNNTVFPWNDKEMRWALNHAIDRDEIVAFAYNGTTIASRHFFPVYPALNRYVDLLEEAGLYNKYPLLEHSTEKAMTIFESKGYTLKDDGYYEKNGRDLSINITTHLSFIEKHRIAEVIIEQLQQAGIKVTTHKEDPTTWFRNFYLGKFEARIGWQACGSVNEPWGSMDTFNTRWLKPVGERTGENQNAWRWSGKAADKYSSLVDQINTLPLGDPRIDKLHVLAMEIWLDELPIIPITQARKIAPFNTTYWTGWPTANNNYIHPPTWWQSTHVIIHNLKPGED